MKQIKSELVDIVEKLLKEKKVDLFVGYEDGSLPLRTSPCFVNKQESVQKLVWNSFCSNNLAAYVRSLVPVSSGPKRIGILCKGCDSRSLANLIVEKQVKREDVVIVGISCSGIVNVDKLLFDLGGKRILGVEEDDDNIKLRFEDGEKRFARKNYLCASCLNCSYPTPSVYDILIRVGKHSPISVSPDPIIAEFNRKSREERWKIFEQELSRCIRCYACRNACPNCYCKECFAEQSRPRWFGLTNEPSDVFFYHVVRILHQAGRCVDCGACVRACPEKIDLRLFTRMLVDEVRERFGYEPGLSASDPSLLSRFSVDDKEEFMLEIE